MSRKKEFQNARTRRKEGAILVISKKKSRKAIQKITRILGKVPMHMRREICHYAIQKADSKDFDKILKDPRRVYKLR